MCYSPNGSDVRVVKEREAMGKEIVYCHKCGIRITEKEFSRGLAHTIANLPSCTRCRPLATPTLPVNDPDDHYAPLTPSGRARSA
jgi:tRNA(Ile2) C34 agmatinyltransferase TiaS